MKTNKELRNDAWCRLWEGKWFWKLVAVSILLAVANQAVGNVLLAVLIKLGVHDWFTYIQLWTQNAQDQVTVVPNLTRAYIVQASAMMVLRLFLLAILGGISAYGGAVVILKAARGDYNRWLADSFAGFKRPFEMAGLLVCYLFAFVWAAFLTLLITGFLAALVVGAVVYLFHLVDMSTLLYLDPRLYSLFLFVGLVVLFASSLYPFYRYRFLFQIKADNPDWGVWRCLRECRCLMTGNIRRSFRLDCSYWGIISLIFASIVLLVLVAGVSAAVNNKATGIALFTLFFILSWFISLALIVIAAHYIHLGQTLLYCELRHEKEQTQTKEQCESEGVLI